MIYTYAKILADSIDWQQQRLTTFEIYFPRVAMPELLRHRMFSFNSASSRAIPIQRNLDEINTEFYEPEDIRQTQKGMQGYENISRQQKLNYHYLHRHLWEETQAVMKSMVTFTNAHKQHVNRYSEPFQYIRMVLSGTDFDNFFKQRIHEAAYPEIRVLAEKMKEALDANIPEYLMVDEWHLPYKLLSDVQASLTKEQQIKVCIARCARVSYNNFDTNNVNIDSDLALFEKLFAANPPHLSPFEHIAKCTGLKAYEVTIDNTYRLEEYQRVNYFANFRGWASIRWLIERGLWGK